MLWAYIISLNSKKKFIVPTNARVCTMCKRMRYDKTFTHKNLGLRTNGKRDIYIQVRVEMEPSRKGPGPFEKHESSM